jgi:hypothetical protein
MVFEIVAGGNEFESVPRIIGVSRLARIGIKEAQKEST